MSNKDHKLHVTSHSGPERPTPTSVAHLRVEAGAGREG